jgi:oligoribonuclease NrnB/cAMP/cGMP phosphodiesterase (DHH superfamily)
MQPLIVYHGNCLDGSTSALCAYIKFGNDVEYYPGIYGAKFSAETKGREVYFLDFSLKRKDMEKLECSRLVVLDHHKTALEELGDMKFEGVLDMNKSGAMLAYEYFKPDLNIDIIKRVQDRDLWKFEFIETEAINAHLFTLPTFTKETAEEWVNTFKNSLIDLSILGQGSLRARKAIVQEAMKRKQKTLLAGYEILVCNATDCFSEVAHELCKNKPFGATYYINSSGKYVYSLRSIGDFDVAEIAKKFGGGGHKNAAGFSVDKPVHE